jgi:Ca2+-binding EF-hand superfamily protein
VTHNRSLLTAVLVLGVSAAAEAQILPPPAYTPAPVTSAPADKRKDEVLDLLYFSPSRPVLVRLHVWVGGKPYRVVLDDFLAKAFKYYDRNRDGVLDKAEVARTPDSNAFANLVNYGFNYSDTQQKMAKIEDVDASKDGKVTPAELSDYLRRGVMMAQLSINTGNNSQSLTDTIYKHLDANKDGKVSREELVAAPVRLRKLDEDDDEVVSSQELSPNPFGSFGVAQVVFDGGGAPMPAVPADNVLAMLLDNPELSKKLGESLLKRFDKNRNKTLSESEFPVEKKTFEGLDADGDGQLDSEELARFGRRGPDLELSCRLGGRPRAGLLTRALTDLARSLGPPNGLEVMTRGKPAPLADAVRKLETGGNLQLVLRDAFVDLASRNTAEQDLTAGVRQFFRDQFRNADGDKSDYLDKKEVQSPSGQFFMAMHTLADLDGDAKLTLKELYGLLDLAMEAPSSTLRIEFSDQGRALFPLIDGNADSMSSVREWRTASERLKRWDHNGDGLLAADEVPRQVSLTVAQGQVNLPSNGGVSFSFGLPRMTPPKEEQKLPEWFRKMDHNGDGDVSVREFLGAEEEFARFDADGDGLISPGEAKKIDSRTRSAAAKP